MEEFKNGNILSLFVKDFQTFAKQAFTFGSSLNLIAAPNGSGKSSIANAIAFVFNGAPKTIGKSKDITEFIRFGCSEAEISTEVFLNGGVVKLSRKIATSHNYYFIDGKLTTQKEYFKFLSSLNIDVNNLCTFLPQERVGEFCRMDAQELLAEMLKNSPTDLTRMKDLYSNLEEINVALSSTKKQKELVESTINILESNMRELREREDSALRLLKLEYKKFFFEYEMHKSQYLCIKRDLSNLDSKIQENTVKIGDYENKIREKEANDTFVDYIRSVEALLSQNRELAGIHDCIRDYTLKLELLKIDREALVSKSIQKSNDMEDKVNELGELKKQLNSTKNEVSKEIKGFKNKVFAICESPEYASLVAPNSTMMNREITTIEELELLVPSPKIIEDRYQGFKQSMAQIQNISHRIQRQIEELEQQKLTYSEQGSVRMEMLKKYHYDSYKGVIWLRENKHVFQDEVLEPCYLHLSLNKDYSDHVEAFLSFQALSSFVVKNDGDFNRLTKLLKDEQGLSINAAVLSSRKMPGLPRRDIERFGLDGVLSDFIECRPEYMDFLNSYGHFNSIPISKKEIREEEIFNKLPMVKRMAIGGRYSEIKRSRYGDDYVIVTNRIFSKGLFVFPKINIEYINSQLADLNREREKNKATMQKILEGKTIMDAKRSALRRELDTSHISRLFFLIKRTVGNIEFTGNEIEALSKEDLESSIKEIDSGIARFDQGIQEEAKKLHALLDLSNIPTFNLEKIKDLKLDLDNDKRSLLFLKYLKETDETNLSCLNSAKDAVRAKIENLKQQITSFPKFDSLDGLPDAIPEIESEMAFLKAKLDVSSKQDHIKEDYKEKENQLNAIFENIGDLKKAQTTFEEEFHSEKSRITAEIYDFLSPVNEKFKELFRKFNFEGRLELDTTNVEWELKILVKFRDCESLQRLSSFRQSGGEKSLTTILFLLALQQCEDAPFRLVDEINQGMDPYNERMVFEILKDMSDKSQFFIITPKLIEGLEFPDNTKAIIVYGGPGITKDLENYAQSILV